jgi:hypothetical protein
MMPCCGECHWHSVDPVQYPSRHSQHCDRLSRRRRSSPGPLLDTERLLAALTLSPQGLRITECRTCFPAPYPSYVAVQRAIRTLRRQQMVVRVARGRYTLTPRYRLFLWEREQNGVFGA